ncbi:MAG: hypothetical protein BA867_04850 [Desulfobacterales bacterium S5133MH16]|jgi:ssDNA-binding Zn-finger/Zn-ribbon topoisomerase 1|nr:MAG: hypothetical protein BA867_04850 [Desulfobacterales bacterium S5133MH16]
MTEKVFIYKDNKTIIICPKCEKSKTIDVSEELGSKYLVRTNPANGTGRPLDRRAYSSVRTKTD